MIRKETTYIHEEELIWQSNVNGTKSDDSEILKK